MILFQFQCIFLTGPDSFCVQQRVLTEVSVHQSALQLLV
uniref:Uncharacterized protein n=1 Tax=Anguilla anguilla TaxID=7936 RepID=A0A0E9VEA7_ANGAN